MARGTAKTSPALWDFCRKLYAQPGIETLCLRLQDEQGVNVLVLLWCAWLEIRGVYLTSEQLATAAEQTISKSESMVVPLRQVRRHLKKFGSLPPDVAKAVKEDILRAELALEKCLLLALEAMRPRSSDSTATKPLDRLVADSHLEDSEAWLLRLRADARRAAVPT
jgi:uncharacterized protein (TIGR02444 family)